MKKLLALVLALVMSLSLVTISSADFKDADKIDYNEAVDVMNAVGVFIGDDNGNFNPKANLERAQAAKIVAYLLLGNKTAEGLAGSGKFTDVAATNWAAGFIDYCAATGVVAGVGNGKFDPNGSLTTLQFAKMLLVALGYDAKIEGFTGNDWSINVSAKANQVGLLSGLDVGANAALTREQAAKMALNTLKAPLVEYDTKGTTVTVGGDASVTVGASKAEFKTSTNKKAQTISNDVINGTTAYTVEFAEEYYSDLKLNSDTTDDFGRPCVEWFWKADSIGVYSNSDDLVATYTAEVTAADVYTAVGKSVSDDVNSGKAKLTTFVDGAKTVVNKTDAKNYVTKNDSTTVNGTGNGDYTEVYVDDDNNVTIVTIRTYLFQAASDYNVKKDTITLTAAGDTKITLDNIVVDGEDFDIKSLKSDDYVLVTASTDTKTNKYTVQSVDAAEVVSGEVTGYKLDNNATIGGTTYKYSSTSLKGTGNVRGTTYTVGQTARIVLDKYGYIIAVDEAVVSSNYVYVSEFAQPSGLSNGKIVASAYFTDGTTADITVKDRLGNSSKTGIMGSPTGGKYFANAGWYTFSKNSANEYSLYAVESKYTEVNSKAYGPADYSAAANADNRVMRNNTVAFMKGVNVRANDNTIVIVDDGRDVNAYTGVKNIPDITLRDNASTTTVNVSYVAKGASDYAYYVFVAVNGNVTVSGNEDSKLVYYVKYDGQFKTTDNKIYYTYKVLDENGKEEVVTFDSQYLGSGSLYAVYNKARVNSDNYITQVTQVTQTAGTKYIGGNAGTASGSSITTPASLTYTDGALSLNGTGYTLADKAKITLVTKGEQKSGNTVIADARELNKDKAAAYEVAVGLSGKALGDLLKDYALVYSWAGKTTDTNGSVIEELFVTVDYANYTKGGVNNGGGQQLQPGEKPVAYISGATITVPEIDAAKSTAAQMSDAANALTNAGYTVTGSLGAGTIMATKGGVSYSFVIVASQYVTLTVNGKVVEYVAADSSFNATADSTTVEKNITGKGTGYLKGSTNYVAYSTTSTTPVIAKASGRTTVIETGYVTINATQTTSVTGLTSTVTVTTGNVAYNKATVKITAAKADVTKDYTITVMNGSDVVKTFTAKAGADIDETVSLGDLTANVAANAITVKADEIKATRSITYPAAVTAKGVTMTITGPATAKEGDTVTAKATFSGTATGGDATFTISGGVTPTWDATRPTGLDVTTAGTPKVTDGTAYLTPVEVLFTFAVGATDVTITLA